ncbi:MAG: O-antigen ligase family protein [Myxococcales bacterium]
MAFVSALLLIVVLVVRPQEIWPSLEVLRLLNVLVALAAIGVILDFSAGKLKEAKTPQLFWVAAFLCWGLAVTAYRLGISEGLRVVWTIPAFSAIFMLVVLYAVSTFERFRAIVVLLLLVSTFVAVVAVHQGMQDPVCIELVETDEGVLPPEDGVPDGRTCESGFMCGRDGKPNVDYACERLGMFHTSSIARRVRWRGQLADPNELSVFIGSMLPLLFAYWAYVKNKSFAIPSVAMTVVFLWAVIESKSRGGQFVIAVVFASYFVSRYRLKGLVLAALMALPVVLLGGREGSDADASSEERTQLLYDGVTIFSQHPIVGVGIGEFKEHMSPPMTAHNSYLLAAAETGVVGFYFWSGMLWSSIKIPLTVFLRPPAGLDAGLRPFAMAMLVSFVGVLIGIFFLSFCYKQLLFIYLGLAGAFYLIVRKDHPDFEVRLGSKDYMGVACVNGIILLGLFVYTRLKG